MSYAMAALISTITIIIIISIGIITGMDIKIMLLSYITYHVTFNALNNLD